MFFVKQNMFFVLSHMLLSNQSKILNMRNSKKEKKTLCPLFMASLQLFHSCKATTSIMFNPFQANVLFWYTLKASENQRSKCNIGWKWVNFNYWATSAHLIWEGWKVKLLLEPTSPNHFVVPHAKAFKTTKVPSWFRQNSISIWIILLLFRLKSSFASTTISRVEKALFSFKTC